MSASESTKVGQELDRLRSPVGMTDIPSLARFLIYGEKYTGKTTVLARIIAALEHRALWLTADSAWSVLKDPRFAPYVDRMPWEGFSMTKAIADRMAHPAENPDWRYDWIVFDPMSTIIYDYVATMTERKKFPKDQYDPDVPGRTHYGLAVYQVRQMLGAFKRLPINIAWVMHQVDKENEVSIRGNAPVESYRTIANEVNLIGWCSKDKIGDKSRKIQVEPSNRITAGTQIPDIPEGIYSTDDFVKLVVNWLRN